MIVRHSMVMRCREGLALMNEPMSYYSMGIRELGKEYMERKYGGSIKIYKEYYNCYLFFALDIARFIGYEDFNIFGGYEGDRQKIFGYILIEIEENFMKRIPNKYIFSVELYNKLLLYSNYLNIVFTYSIRNLTGSCDLDIDGVDNSLLLDLMLSSSYGKSVDMKEVKKGTNKEAIDNFRKVMVDYLEVYSVSKVRASEDLKITIEYRKEKIDEMFYDGYDKMYEEYMKEYKELEDPYTLISERYILEYRDKYCK